MRSKDGVRGENKGKEGEEDYMELLKKLGKGRREWRNKRELEKSCEVSEWLYRKDKDKKGRNKDNGGKDRYGGGNERLRGKEYRRRTRLMPASPSLVPISMAFSIFCFAIRIVVMFKRKEWNVISKFLL